MLLYGIRRVITIELQTPFQYPEKGNLVLKLISFGCDEGCTDIKTGTAINRVC